jgi:NAD(P)-dependent dehydrogenase (short-subunit alcohol dehydrogenase family)
MKSPAIVLPRFYADRIAASGKNSGALDLKWDATEALAVVDGFREGLQGTRIQGLSAVPGRHYLGYASTNVGMGLWFRVEPVLHLFGIEAARRIAAVDLGAFRRHVVNGNWTNPGHGAYTLAITVTTLPETDRLDFAAWRLHPENDSAEMLPIDVAEEEFDLLAPLQGVWPVEDLAGKTIALIGAGSIGSAAAESLAAYGIHHLVLVDPDRLQSHNFARHRVHPKDLGRHKVTALFDRLQERDPAMKGEALTIDVVYDADLVRPILREVDVVLVSSDGVDSRRAANHLIYRANKSAVFACVLADGAFGEILRIRPPRTGCLSCARAALFDNGGMSPEPTLDRGYGEGTRHLPMTAVGGDLGFVGQLAAKAAVATILEGLGYREQRLPGDSAVMGLQPKPGMAPPFNIEFAGEVRWSQLPPPREDCPTCGHI